MTIGLLILGIGVSAQVTTNRTTAPTASSSTLDYNDGTLVITFSEKIDASTVNLSKIHLNNVTGTNNVTLTGATAGTTDGTTLTITLTEAQRLAVLALSGVAGGDGGAVFLDMDAAAIADMGAANIAIDD